MCLVVIKHFGAAQIHFGFCYVHLGHCKRRDILVSIIWPQQHGQPKCVWAASKDRWGLRADNEKKKKAGGTFVLSAFRTLGLIVFWLSCQFWPQLSIWVFWGWGLGFRVFLNYYFVATCCCCFVFYYWGLSSWVILMCSWIQRTSTLELTLATSKPTSTK
jgi:hypothetical protein